MAGIPMTPNYVALASPGDKREQALIRATFPRHGRSEIGEWSSHRGTESEAAVLMDS